MHILNEQNIKSLEEKIKHFEISTKGEIRLAVLDSSDPYPGANYRLAFTLSFILTSITELIYPLSGEQALILVLSLLMTTFALAPFLPFRSWFILNSEKNREVKERATSLFFLHGLANTKNRIGILLMVSALEKKIELLVDQTILEKIGQTALDQIVKEIGLSFKEGQYESGLRGALDFLEQKILQAFPNGLQELNSNEIHNTIILS